MKIIYLIALLALAGSEMLRAQTNAAALPKPPPQTVITSDHAEFDPTERRAIYYDNVIVVDPQMTLTCARLIGDLPRSQGTGLESKHIVALTNVVIISVDDKGQTTHATSDKAVYDYKVVNGVTNETVTLTGHAKVENAQGTQTGEPIWWDRVNNSFHANNYHMISSHGITSVLANTNAPAGKTNLPTAMKGLPASKTNYPPGTIQNIDRIPNQPSNSTPH